MRAACSGGLNEHRARRIGIAALLAAAGVGIARAAARSS